VRLRGGGSAYVLRAKWWGETGCPDGYTVLPLGAGGDVEVRADQVLGPAEEGDTR
jgi:hypothetical protein